MQKSPAISVVVPVYNVEQTLARCLDSIFNQTFKDYEIILVNDGSTDNSGKLCDEYASKYSNIRVIHKENEGLGPTRNVGIRESKGEYVYHCDSDDWLKEDLLEKAYNTAIKTSAEVVIFGYEIFVENNEGVKPYKKICAKEHSYKTNREIKSLFVEHYFSSYVMMSACTRMCKRTFLIENELFFPALRRCQDMAYSLLIFDKAQSLAVIEEPFYCYIIQPGTYKGRSFDEMISLYSTIDELLTEKFILWGENSELVMQKLNNDFCEKIANYSTHAFAVKYKNDFKINATKLVNNNKIRKAFKKYRNIKKSKFMWLFKIALLFKNKTALLILSKRMQSKVSKV